MGKLKRVENVLFLVGGLHNAPLFFDFRHHIINALIKHCLLLRSFLWGEVSEGAY